jgi:SAM-dependent methyltransferase
MPQDYLEKYRHGVGTRNHSLREYEFFISNITTNVTLAGLVEKFLEIREKVKILDLGSGEGQALKELKERFGKKIETIGIDLFDAPKENFDTFIQGNALEADWPTECDIVLGFRSLHEMGQIKTIFEKLNQALKAGGISLLSIRVMDSWNNSMQFMGAMEKQDLTFLEDIVTKGAFESLRIDGRKIEVDVNGKRYPSGMHICVIKIVLM